MTDVVAETARSGLDYYCDYDHNYDRDHSYDQWPMAMNLKMTFKVITELWLWPWLSLQLWLMIMTDVVAETACAGLDYYTITMTDDHGSDW